MLAEILFAAAAASMDDAALDCLSLRHPSKERVAVIMQEDDGFRFRRAAVKKSHKHFEKAPFTRRNRPAGGRIPLRRQGEDVIYTVVEIPSGAAALCHNHPSSGWNVVPGPKDWKAVKEDRPSYIVHRDRMIVIELDGGDYSWRPIAGDITRKEVAKLNKAVRIENEKS